MENRKKHHILFDIDIYEKIKGNEENISSFDFKPIISYYIEAEGDQISEHILHLISEKISLGTLESQLIAFYVTCIIYCLWKNIAISFEFQSFATEEVLKVLTEVNELIPFVIFLDF